MSTNQIITTLSLTFICMLTNAENGKLLATSGVGSIEGSGGGGLIPWAMLAGYTTKDEIGFNATMSYADLKDFSLSSHSFSTSFNDRIEVSLSKIRFLNKAGGIDIKLNAAGAKVRLFGDAIYGKWPLLSAGIQHKQLLDTDIANALGAKETDGTDFYLSTAKAWINGPFNRTALMNMNLRYSKANQLGLLGFGTNDSNKMEPLYEVAATIFLTRRLAVGIEYRQKPDNINNLKEDDWKDVFIAYFPSKSLSLTFAYLRLGELAGEKEQNGSYISIQGAF